MPPTLESLPLPVAVIGAGLSGLACAHALAQAGQAVALFDKSRGPSGRMSTRRTSDADGQGLGDWQCDHGAQYFTARDAAFRDEVARWQAAGVAAPWRARIATWVDGVWGEPNTTPDRFVGTPRMTSPAGWLVQQLGPAVHTQWATTVLQLQREAQGWALATAEHGVLAQRFQVVLLAVPAPQAVPLLQPVCPAGAAVAASAHMRGCWAVMVRTAQPVALPCDGAFINTGPLRWIANDRSKPGRSGPCTWLLHASPEWSESHIEASPAHVTALLLAAFEAVGGPPAHTVQATAHRWRYADTQPPLTLGSWWDGKAGLGLCGDWLHGGKVEGAWLSGRHLAAQAEGRAIQRR